MHKQTTEEALREEIKLKALPTKIDGVFVLLPHDSFFNFLKNAIEWMTKLTEPERSGCAHSIVSHIAFRAFCLFTIVLNALFTSVVAERDMSTVGASDAGEFPGQNIFERIFVAIYLVELVLKLICHRLYFFVNKEARWNNFDLFLIAMSLYDLGREMFSSNSSANMSFMRIGRLLKLTKVLRLCRAVRFMSQLQLMLVSVVNSFVMLFWCVVMLSCMWWALTLVMMQGLTAYLQDGGENIEPETREFIVQNFGTLPSGMILFFQLATGGTDWVDTYHILAAAGSAYQVLLLCYIGFFSFALFNILTGMVVENVMATQDKDDEETAAEFREQTAAQVKALQHVFRLIDVDHSGHLTFQEFETALASSPVRARLAEVGVSIVEANIFFAMLLKVSDNQKVNIDAFVNGCLHVRGKAAALDVQVLLFETRLLHKQMAKSLGLSEAMQDAESSNERTLRVIQGAAVSLEHRLASVLNGPKVAQLPKTPKLEGTPRCKLLKFSESRCSLAL